MSPRQVTGLKTGKKCPRNGIIMAPSVGTRARERMKVGQWSNQGPGCEEGWPEAHPMAQDEMRLHEGLLATHLTTPHPFRATFSLYQPFPPYF